VRQIALGVYEGFHNFFEGFQAGNGNSLRGVVDAVTSSSFSEEDLTSDLIGFYRALWQEKPGTSPFSRGYDAEGSKQAVRKLCKVVGLTDDKETRIKKQVEIFLRYDLPPVNGFQDVHEWGKPRLVDLSSEPLMPQNIPSMFYETTGLCGSRFCTEPNRQFPPELSQVAPISAGALWRWNSAMSYALGKYTFYLP
jgi:hypothetical protein